MMLSRLVLASLCTGALAGIFPRDSWGPAVSLGPIRSTIKKSTVIIVPNSPPPSQAGLLYLWPGMSNGTGDLIQSTIDQYPNGGGCGAGGTGKWCGGASLFGSVGQISGPYVPVSATQRIKIVYERGASAGNGLWAWTQTVSDATTGSVLSTLTHNSGTMIGWGTAVECNDGCSGTTCTHWYQDATIELDSADTTFTSTLGASQGASYSNVVSSNGGQTWKIGLITIPAMNPGGGSCALSSPPSGSSGTTTIASTTKATTTIKTTTTATPSGNGGTQVLYGQCGGIGWTGPTKCASGSTCKYSNDWYSQCLP